MTTPENAMAALVTAVQTRLAADVAGAAFIDGDPSFSDAPTPEAGQVAVFLLDRGAVGSGEGGWWRETQAHVECLVQGATRSARATRLRALLDAVEAALAADRSLGGVVVSSDWEAADPTTLPVEGAEDVASETVLVTLEYHSETQL